jgi:ABC-2 type transport system permease protein
MWLAEFGLLFRRVRTRVLLFVLAAVPVAVAVAVRLSGEGPNPGQGPQFFDQITHNGVFAALAGLTVTLPFFLPLAVAIVAGDAVAGEANLGTLRYVLSRPCGRTRLLVLKGTTVTLFCFAATFAVALAGLIAGSILFPIGDVTTLSGDTLSLAAGTLRIGLAAVLVALSLLGLAAIGMFISTLTDAPVGAMAGTVGVAVLSGVLNAVPALSWLHPFLLTHYWLSFGDVLRSPVYWNQIVLNLIVQVVAVGVFATAAWARFTSKDVLA